MSDIIDRTIKTPIYLNEVLNRIKNDIIENKNLEIEKQNAQLIENFLNAIGGHQQDPDNLIEGLTNQLLQEALNKLNINSSWFFNNQKNDLTGISFEKYLEKLLNEILEKPDISTYQSKKYVVNLGSKYVDIFKNITDDLENETVNETMKKFYTGIKNKLIEDDKKAKEKRKKSQFVSSVQGKIDVAKKYIDFKVIVNDPVLEKVLPLLAESSFTIKAYKTMDTVKIGQTNPYRVFLATSDKGSIKQKTYQWIRMLYCMDLHPTENAALLFYQIRYIYELTGYGQQYVENKISEALGQTGAKYFIYYHPGTGVKVLSTAVIINNFLDMVKNDKYFETYSSKYGGDYKNPQKHYALYARLKMRMFNGEFEFA